VLLQVFQTSAQIFYKLKQTFLCETKIAEKLAVIPVKPEKLD